MQPFPEPRVVRTRYPVLLMHGFGLLAALRRGGHLHTTAMSLRQHGVLAYAPNVAPYSTVSIRAEQWAARIEQILAETGASQLNVIAHSMGGLDARYLVSVTGLHEVVATLVTVSAPHFGTSIANHILERPRVLRGLIADACNWMGSHATEEVRADFEQAVAELTPHSVRERFNPQVRDHDSVRYWSYAGRAGRGTDVSINPFLIPLNNALYALEGENDGFVSVESARWGTFLGTVDADHAATVGLAGLPKGGNFDSGAFYLSVVEMLAREGF